MNRNMNRNKILAKSKAENKNKDMYEQEVLKQASRNAVVVQMDLAILFFVAQIFAEASTGDYGRLFSAQI